MKSKSICETCYERDVCELKPLTPGVSWKECDFYFPDVSPNPRCKPKQTPAAILTPERREG